MKFIITRTSTEHGSERPCEEATEQILVKDKHWDVDRSAELWAIDISTIEELMTLEQKYGELIITRCTFDKNLPEIEIYDSWRE